MMEPLKKIPKKTLRIVLILLLAAAVVLVLCLSWYGTVELASFNARSLTDWRLGSSIDYIRNEEDAKYYDDIHYDWFSDELGQGIVLVGTDTKYYLGNYPDSGFGKYRVIGFSSSEEYYSILGIRVGDDELSAKTALLDSNYTMFGGGFNTCSARCGNISVVLDFERGTVTNISVFLEATSIFG